MIDFFCYNQDEIEFIWHGGEPLLAGLDFYRKVAEFQHKWIQQGKKIINFLQTNATLINSELTDFFMKNNFIIGVSVKHPVFQEHILILCLNFIGDIFNSVIILSLL